MCLCKAARTIGRTLAEFRRSVDDIKYDLTSTRLDVERQAPLNPPPTNTTTSSATLSSPAITTDQPHTAAQLTAAASDSSVSDGSVLDRPDEVNLLNRSSESSPTVTEKVTTEISPPQAEDENTTLPAEDPVA